MCKDEYTQIDQITISILNGHPVMAKTDINRISATLTTERQRHARKKGIYPDKSEAQKGHPG